MTCIKCTFLVAPLLSTGIALSLSLVHGEIITVEDQPAGEIRIVPNGVNPSPNWGLEKIGEQQDDAEAYTYPDTSNPVRLYLIDTAVANPGDWMGQNAKLDFEETVIVGASSDPDFSSQFGHGTRMLSLIAGLKTGIAPGTPIKVINYDVYPGGPTTTATKLSAAIVEAVAHYQDSDPQVPSVICLASGSDMLGSSISLQNSVQWAVDEGITVVFSAGNSGANAADYIPAAYGNIEGAICVGASDASDQVLPISNTGTPVDILAPGDLIQAQDDDTEGYVLMQGTSPAAALVVGSALAELSMNGSLTPAEVEALLIASATPSQTPDAPPVLRTTSTASAHIALPDGSITDPLIQMALSCDSFPDIDTPPGEDFSARSESESESESESTNLEVLYGTNQSSDSTGSVAISSSDEIEFTFPIDFSVVDPDHLFALNNGYSWRIRCTQDMTSWDIPAGKLTKRTAADGTVWITAAIPKTSDSCFLRLEVAKTPVTAEP